MIIKKYHVIIEADIFRNDLAATYDDVLRSFDIEIDGTEENVEVKLFEVFDNDSIGHN